MAGGVGGGGGSVNSRRGAKGGCNRWGSGALLGARVMPGVAVMQQQQGHPHTCVSPAV